MGSKKGMVLDGLMQVKTAASVLGVCPNTLRNWTNERLIACCRDAANDRWFVVAKLKALRALATARGRKKVTKELLSGLRKR